MHFRLFYLSYSVDIVTKRMYIKNMEIKNTTQTGREGKIMIYKLKSNLNQFHEFFDDSVSVKESVLEETRNVKKDHALLVVRGFFNADDSEFNGPEDKRPCFSERIVARIWRRHRAYWVAEIWHQGECVLSAGHSKGKAAQVAKFVLNNVEDGREFRSPGYVW